MSKNLFSAFVDTSFYGPSLPTPFFPELKKPGVQKPEKPVDTFNRITKASPEYGAWKAGDYVGINLPNNTENQIRRLFEICNHGFKYSDPVVPKGSSATVDQLKKKHLVGLFVKDDLPQEQLNAVNDYIKGLLIPKNVSVEEMFEARENHREAIHRSRESQIKAAPSLGPR